MLSIPIKKISGNCCSQKTHSKKHESKDKNEDEPVAQIKFTILKDGTIVTDSDYLPNDVNERAHDAMDVLEQLLGNKRVMTKKPVPAKYLSKMKPRRVNTQNIEQK